MSGLGPILDEARSLVFVGPGGVGKTSTSAAVAIEAARRGRRAVVLTIDPARRLANALGLPEIGSVETDIPPEAFQRAGLTPPAGRLSALMLDIKEAWDDVIHRYHPDPVQRQKLLDNRLYHALSTALAGSQEYMAMEKLHRLAHRTEDRPDLIVLDTPPATHALDFLEAPNRIVDALDNDATRWLLEPSKGGRGLSRRMFGAGSSLFIKTIARFTGIELLEELAELLGAFSSMFDGFRERARAVKSLLAEPETRFCVVGHPSSVGLVDARSFVERLDERDVHLAAMVLNRATVDPYSEGSADPEGLRRAVASVGGSRSLAERLEAVAEDAARIAREERAGARALAEDFARRPVVVVPELPRDVHDLESLEQLRRHLFAHP
ncbi:MAG: ArsA-related P-loop ATPase [Myxococcota bacterium]